MLTGTKISYSHKTATGSITVIGVIGAQNDDYYFIRNKKLDNGFYKLRKDDASIVQISPDKRIPDAEAIKLLKQHVIDSRKYSNLKWAECNKLDVCIASLEKSLQGE